MRGETHSPFITLAGVHKSFHEGGRRVPIMADLCGAIAQGEMVALAGRSGSGKTTLLNLIAGIDRPDGGTIQVAGQEVSALSERQRDLFRRHHVGYVFQFFNLIPTLTVLENLLLPLALTGVSPADGKGRALALLDRLGLLGRHGRFPDRLSGGERQRVAVARALIHGPRLLLADEPTGSLDRQSGEEVMALLVELVREKGITLLLATHSLELAKVADRLLTLREGRLWASEAETLL